MFFTFPEEAGTPIGRSSSSGSRSASSAEWSGCRGVVFQRLLLETPTPERCVEAYYLK